MPQIVQDPLELYAGHTAKIKFTLTDAAAAPVDITGHVITFRLGARPPSPALVEKTNGAGVAITDAPAGEFEVTIAGADTIGLEGRFAFQTLDLEPGGDSFVIAAGDADILPVIGPAA